MPTLCNEILKSNPIGCWQGHEEIYNSVSRIMKW
jgi:hypothetical protein